MGSPSRNVQYHPPRLSEDRLNLPQPHSPSLPTHCSGKSGMRPTPAGVLCLWFRGSLTGRKGWAPGPARRAGPPGATGRPARTALNPTRFAVALGLAIRVARGYAACAAVGRASLPAKDSQEHGEQKCLFRNQVKFRIGQVSTSNAPHVEVRCPTRARSPSKRATGRCRPPRSRGELGNENAVGALENRPPLPRGGTAGRLGFAGDVTATGRPPCRYRCRRTPGGISLTGARSEAAAQRGHQFVQDPHFGRTRQLGAPGAGPSRSVGATRRNRLRSRRPPRLAPVPTAKVYLEGQPR